MIQFDIDQWQAWAPGLASVGDWTIWAREPYCVEPGDQMPDVTFLPAMQRRRLSRLARMAFTVATPLAEGKPPLPLVYASRHGETPRTFAILDDLAREEPVSPTQFSLSVHNAVIGLWSIQREDTSEMTALAAEGDGLEHAVLEAALLLAEGAPGVLVVIAEDKPPAAYEPWISDVPFPYALGLLLTPGNSWRLSLETGDPSEHAPGRWPHALELIRALVTGQPHREHQWKGRRWNWQHTH
ncbi:beta-ketoacyl synthase chain length factor [Stutzerimonas chloritidismutans]|uniref:beta-ketoacyl synthase chain length factor n=1 Tax=Stutzerimonas chloritidismutans TaxID=203192 RepID=UPI003F17A939